MSYTHKKVVWNKFLSIDTYGDPIRIVDREAICSPTSIVGTLLCGQMITAPTLLVRKQNKGQVIKDNEGREFISKSVYYLDPRIEPNALSVGKMDLLDNELVEDVYYMNDLFNKTKMIRVITI